MIRCVVVDDEPLAVELLESYISKIDFLELVFSSESPVKALNFLATEKVDMLFLDIQMPEMNGIELMEIINDKVKVIITSAFAEFALKGYEHNIIDYLLKPLEFNRFCKAVNRAKQTFELQQVNPASNTPARNFCFIKTDGKLVKIMFDEILFVEGLKDYVAIQTANDRLISLDSLLNMENILPSHLFCRIHKSFIVGVTKIDTIEKNRIFINSHVLPIGEVYKNNFMGYLNK